MFHSCWGLKGLEEPGAPSHSSLCALFHFFYSGNFPQMSHWPQYAPFLLSQQVLASFTPLAISKDPSTSGIICATPCLFVPLQKKSAFGKFAGIASPPSLRPTLWTYKSLDLRAEFSTKCLCNLCPRSYFQFAWCINIPSDFEIYQMGHWNRPWILFGSSFLTKWIMLCFLLMMCNIILWSETQKQTWWGSHFISWVGLGGETITMHYLSFEF